MWGDKRLRLRFAHLYEPWRSKKRQEPLPPRTRSRYKEAIASVYTVRKLLSPALRIVKVLIAPYKVDGPVSTHYVGCCGPIQRMIRGILFPTL